MKGDDWRFSVDDFNSDGEVRSDNTGLTSGQKVYLLLKHCLLVSFNWYLLTLILWPLLSWLPIRPLEILPVTLSVQYGDAFSLAVTVGVFVFVLVFVVTVLLLKVGRASYARTPEPED